MTTLQTKSHQNGAAPPSEIDAVIVGAGFAGLYMLHRLRGLGITARVFEAGDGVGGTWYWNRYPGARCDVESMEYQYGFDGDLPKAWKWSERYATQPEILEYINYVADRFELRDGVQFETRVTSASFDEATNRWSVQTNRGDNVSAKYCIMATGCLSSFSVPKFKGLDSYKGDWYHTGAWPHEGVDFTGKRVGIIGTGSSAIQSIPIIAEQAAHLTVFQRTPNFSVPADNGPIDSEYQARLSENFTEHRREALDTQAGLVRTFNNQSVFEVDEETRMREFQNRWKAGSFAVAGAFNDLAVKKEANDFIADFVRSKIREVVHDAATAELLCPKDYPFGTKRLCVDSHYFQTFNRDNVSLVDVKNAPIEEITEKGLRTGGKEYEFDCLVFATGFDAMTGSLTNIDIRGREGLPLKEKWSAGPRTYLGLQSVGFPNMFTITGPGSPSVLANMIVAIEQHVDWISDCVQYMRTNNLATIEANLDAEDTWVEHVNEVANKTLYPQANSWYLGANVPGKPRVFMPYVGGLGTYGKKLQDVVDHGYDGFTLGVGARELVRV